MTHFLWPVILISYSSFIVIILLFNFWLFSPSHKPLPLIFLFLFYRAHPVFSLSFDMFRWHSPITFSHPLVVVSSLPLFYRSSFFLSLSLALCSCVLILFLRLDSFTRWKSWVFPSSVEPMKMKVRAVCLTLLPWWRLTFLLGFNP